MQNRFRKISSICPDHSETWTDKIFLAFDVDWPHDEIILDCYQIVENAEFQSTWFCTHDSDYLRFLKDDPKVELGIHPNFNDLLTLS